MPIGALCAHMRKNFILDRQQESRQVNAPPILRISVMAAWKYTFFTLCLSEEKNASYL